MIRYYESVGLVRGIQRTEAGYRDFDESDVALLSFIRRARDLGMPVARIAQLLDVMARGEDVRPILSAHADDLRRKIDEVAEKHGVVRELRSGWSATLTAEQLAAVQFKARHALQRLVWSAPLKGGRIEPDAVHVPTL